MDFPKVAACCADMVAFVRVTACRFPVNRSMHHNFYAPLDCYYSFCCKEIQNLLPDNGYYYYW